MFLILAALAFAKNIIIIDAGSSGTRLYIFTYEDVYSLDSYDILRDFEGKPISIKSSITLTSTLNNKTRSAELFRELFDNGSHLYIERTARSTTPVYLYATGGMRQLESKEDKNSIIADAYQIANEKYLYLVKENYFRIISGEEEAQYAWIAANLFIGDLANNQFLTTAEIGGASAQFSQHVFTPTKDLKDFMKKITINKVSYDVFGYSWANYGGDSVEKAILTLLKSQNKFESPCHLRNTPNLGKKYGFNATFTGKPDFEACQKLISHIYAKSDSNKCGDHQELFLKGRKAADGCVPYPGGNKEAVVYGVPSYTMEYLNYTDSATIENYLYQVYTYGNRSYEEAVALNPTYRYTDIAYLQQHLTIRFIVSGTNGEIRQMTRVNPAKFKGLKLDWPIGAAIAITSARVIIGTPIHFIIIIVAGILIGIAFIIAMIYCLINHFRKKKQADKMVDLPEDQEV